MTHADTTSTHRCRACAAPDGEVVLDLGEQPAADHFPPADDPGPDPVHPLQMWLCARCGLAQLLTDPTTPEEPRGAEPAALVEQAADAVGRVAAAGWLPGGGTVIEYGSPHGGSWLGLLADRGLTAVDDGEPADVVLDCFGMMHAPDQAAAIAERADRLRPGGVLLLQFHSLATIVRHGQWNSLRHGHFAYYSVTALRPLLASVGLVPRTAWTFDLYAGTVLLAATRPGEGGPGDRAPVPAHGGSGSPGGAGSGSWSGDPGVPADAGEADVPGAAAGPDSAVEALLADERALQVDDPERLRHLQRDAENHARGLRSWLTEQRDAGRRVLGYGAASRAVALLCRAGIDRSLLLAVADASPAKQGRRMPATDVPVVAPHDLVAARPDAVALFLPDLLDEVRRRLPEIEAAGGAWVDVDGLPSPSGR